MSGPYLYLLHLTGWMRINIPQLFDGMRSRLHLCGGCNQSLSTSREVLLCCFRTRGFDFANGSPAFPCQTGYHVACFRVGPPFTSRRKEGGGLSFPKVTVWPNFICEACMVRSVLDRELTGKEDWKLLCFERMRILDLAHSWALRTHEGYQSRLRYLHRFERFFGVSILQVSQLQKPPSGPEVALMWAEEQYSLRLTPETLARWKATGPGWQTRMADVLRESV